MVEVSRRSLLAGLGVGIAVPHPRETATAPATAPDAVDPTFPVKASELTLRFHRDAGERRLSFANFTGSLAAWRTTCRDKLADLLGFTRPGPRPVKLLRATEHRGVTVEAWVMEVDSALSVPAYLLTPQRVTRSAVMALHGHGTPEPLIGLRDDYHHRFAIELAREGHLVLCPTLRGFGSLGDLALGDERHTLDYWVSARGKQFSLVTDAYLYGKTLIGETMEDLLRWEGWLAETKGVTSIDVAGISYGGDLAFTYPVFSRRVDRIYSSGSLGSFSGVFSRCYNAPAHGIPGVLQWMDRSDIAGLNAPRLQRFHYGELDTPGPSNNSASYNETVAPSLAELRAIYRAGGADGRVSLRVTESSGHEMDVPDLRAFLSRGRHAGPPVERSFGHEPGPSGGEP